VEEHRTKKTGSKISSWGYGLRWKALRFCRFLILKVHLHLFEPVSLIFSRKTFLIYFQPFLPEAINLLDTLFLSDSYSSFSLFGLYLINKFFFTFYLQATMVMLGLTTCGRYRSPTSLRPDRFRLEWKRPRRKQPHRHHKGSGKKFTSSENRHRLAVRMLPLVEELSNVFHFSS
jgi:hypothetical protein